MILGSLLYLSTLRYCTNSWKYQGCLCHCACKLC